MILVKTLDFSIEGDVFLYEGNEVPGITIENAQDAYRTIRISPKHRETYLDGFLLKKGENGYIYVVDNLGICTEKYIEIDSNGVPSREPEMSYREFYILRKSKQAAIDKEMDVSFKK